MANTITGNIKVFKQNYLAYYSPTVTVSSGSGSADNLSDFSRDTKWESSGSDDTTTESIIVEFDNALDVDRILLLNHNFKDYDIQYWNGSSYVDFSNVYDDKDAVVASDISFTANALTSSYFEFTSVSTLKIRIQCTTTQTTDAEKYLYELYIGQEIGTFTDDITSNPSKYEPVVRGLNQQVLTLSNNATVTFQRGDKFSADVNIRQLWETEDIAIIDTMFEDGQFAWYPCGGYNHYTTLGWRIRDLYNVVIVGDQQAAHNIGRDKSLGYDYKFELREQ